MICPLPQDVSTLVRAALADSGERSLTFPQILALRRAQLEGLGVELDDSVLTSANAEALMEPGHIAVPGLHGQLYAYQSKGISWMKEAVQRTGGVILADEMGLGKTIQIICLLLLEPPSPDHPALIVCPTTLIANWTRELDRFAPSLDVAIHRGPDRARLPRHLQRTRVLITTYDTLVNDLVLMKAIEWSWLICDEAQAIKNPASQRRRAIGEIPRKRAIPVTGTPVENHLIDLWSLVDVAIPGLLGPLAWFEKQFDDTEESARYLSRITNPIILKRQVRDVAQDLPERIDVNVPLELGPVLSLDYEAVRRETLDRYPTAGALVATGQLQLFCAHPLLRTNSITSSDWEDGAFLDGALVLSTPKLERAVELLEEAFANGKKALIFANFNACGPIIQAAAHNLPTAFWGAVNGSTPSGERQAIIDAFSAHTGPGVLILNPRAAGAGLNITAATVVIHFTQVWNPALELQASARAYRRGQTQPVTIYHMFYVDTVEEVMMERAERRRLLGAEAVPVTNDNADLARALSLSPVSP
jgi:SNF2 family DNA or RNA helicase